MKVDTYLTYLFNLSDITFKISFSWGFTRMLSNNFLPHMVGLKVVTDTFQNMRMGHYLMGDHLSQGDYLIDLMVLKIGWTPGLCFIGDGGHLVVLLTVGRNNFGTFGVLIYEIHQR